MSTRTLVTAEELLAMPNDGMRHELVEGELTAMTPAGKEHGRISFRVAGLIWDYLKRNPIGEGYGAETGFWIGTDPDTVRAPDAAFVSEGRLAEVEQGRGFGRGAPDLAVEVISPDDTYGEVERKVEQWLAGGARLVWVVNPRSRTVTVHAAGAPPATLREDETLDGGDVLPGFANPVAELFA